LSNIIFLKMFTTWIDDLMIKWSAGILDASLGQGQMESVKKIISFVGPGDYYSQFWSIVNVALKAVRPFGFAIITTYFLMFLFDAAAKDNVTVDSLIKVLIQLVLVIAMIKNLDLIINSFLSLNETLIAKMGNIGPKSASVEIKGTDFVNEWYDAGTNVFVIWIQCVVIWLIHQIAVIAVDFAIIQRAIEIGWRSVFAPIGVANCFEGGANSAGIRYLKTLFTVIMSGAAIYLTAALGFSITAGMLKSATSSTIWIAVASMLGTAGAAIGVGNKIRDVAQ